MRRVKKLRHAYCDMKENTYLYVYTSTMSKAALVGKFVNQSFGSDCEPIGKIIGTFGKTGMIIQPWKAEQDPNWKAEFIRGGYAGHCINNYDQKWVYSEVADAEPIRMRHSAKLFGRNHWIADKPHKHYDYNF